MEKTDIALDHSPKRPPRGKFALGMIGGLAIALAIWIATSFGTLSSTRFSLNQPAVVNRIQELKRLETVVFTLDKVVAAERSGVLPQILTGDRILLVVRGEVTAGVDFAKLRPQDVIITGQSLKLRMPRAEIFSTRIDNQKTQVFSRQTGLLIQADPNLESETRRRAETEIHDAALNGGILLIAEQNARATLTSLLQGLGFQPIEIK